MEQQSVSYDDYVQMAKEVVAFMSKYNITYLDAIQILKCAKNVMLLHQLQS